MDIGIRHFKIYTSRLNYKEVIVKTNRFTVKKQILVTSRHFSNGILASKIRKVEHFHTTKSVE